MAWIFGGVILDPESPSLVVGLQGFEFAIVKMSFQVVEWAANGEFPLHIRIPDLLIDLINQILNHRSSEVCLSQFLGFFCCHGSCCSCSKLERDPHPTQRPSFCSSLREPLRIGPRINWWSRKESNLLGLRSLKSVGILAFRQGTRAALPLLGVSSSTLPLRVEKELNWRTPAPGREVASTISLKEQGALLLKLSGDWIPYCRAKV